MINIFTWLKNRSITASLTDFGSNTSEPVSPDDSSICSEEHPVLPPIESGKKMPETVSELKEWHCRVLHRLDKHPENENFTGYMTLEVDIPNFIQLAQKLALIDWSSYEESLNYLKKIHSN